MHQRTKHIELEHHYIREKYEDGTIVISYVPTTFQQADILTKPLEPGPFIDNRTLAGLRRIPTPYSPTSSLNYKGHPQSILDMV
jgi:hypothetical protein